MLRRAAGARSRRQRGDVDSSQLLTSQLWEEGVRSSYFLPVNTSMATKWHLAWPCLPVLEVDTSATCRAGSAGGLTGQVAHTGDHAAKPLPGV